MKIVLLIALLYFLLLQINLNHSQIEMQCYHLLANEKRTYLFLLKYERKNQIETDSAVLDVAFENLCNAYDIFCGKYLAGEVNKKRFLSDYAGEIIYWVDTFPKKYGENSHFQNTVKVCEKLRKLEI